MNDKKQLKLNILYNGLYQVLNLIVPLITAPYISRTLGAEPLGTYDYVLANTGYFLMLQGLGFGLYGSIRVAAVRDDPEALNQVFWKVFLAKLLLCAATVISFLIFIPFQKSSYRSLYLIFLLSILAGGIDLSWFLTGLEQFKITLSRNAAVRVASCVLIFLLVRSKNDLGMYAVIMQGAALVGNLCLLPGVRPHIGAPRFKGKELFVCMAESMVYFVPGIINTIFASVDRTMLGSMSRIEEVAYYEQAVKIVNLCSTLISSVSAVILPRMTYLFHNEKDPHVVQALFYRSMNGIFAVTAAVSFGAAAIADLFIPAFFGEEFTASAPLLKILSINIFTIAVSNFCGQQGLIARGRQREYNISITVSAALNVGLNALVVRRFGAVGVSATSAFAGIVGLFVILFFMRDFATAAQLLNRNWKYLAAGAVMLGTVAQLPDSLPSWPGVFLRIALGGAVYFVLLGVLRDEFFLDLVRSLWKRRNTP